VSREQWRQAWITALLVFLLERLFDLVVGAAFR
jgi:hypothetical protein